MCKHKEFDDIDDEEQPHYENYRRLNSILNHL